MMPLSMEKQCDPRAGELKFSSDYNDPDADVTLLFPKDKYAVKIDAEVLRVHR